MPKITKAQLEKKIEATRAEIEGRLDILSKMTGKDKAIADVFSKHLRAILDQLNGVPDYAKEE